MKRRLAIILPRGTNFAAAGATAIDLCVRDQCAALASVMDCLVIGNPVVDPFPDVPYFAIADGLGRRERYRAFADAARAFDPDVVVIHQHIPSAVAIAASLRGMPICLYRHNVPNSSLLKRWVERRKYSRFDRTIWISRFTRGRFCTLHPGLAERAVVVSNGFQLINWMPACDRENIILFAGRASDEKGGVEAAGACARILQRRLDWRAHFILSTIDRDRACVARITAALAPVLDQVKIEFDVQYKFVKAAFETAEIALVPSIYEESFGRTAVEALAGGAALICSRSGALPEVAGEAALYVETVTTDSLANALDTLIGSEAERRRLKRAGQERATAFDISTSAADLERVISDLMMIARKD
jgi:glycosyltransferase involved in cell wall biosynthesis